MMMIRFALFALLAAAGAACHSSPSTVSAAADTPRTVTVEPAAMHAVRDTFEAGGVVAARTTAAIASRIVATVQSVTVAPGDRVRTGQRLIVLDGRDLDAGRRQASAAAAALERSAGAAGADREAAAAALTLARATHDRLAALHARRAATSQELDEARSTLRIAEARLQAADARIAELDAARESARAAAAGAAVSATFAVLRAPFDGIVTEKLVEPGNLAGIGVPLLRVEDAAGFRLDVRLDESRASSIATGDPVHVRLGSSVPSRDRTGDLAGRVAEVSRAIEAASHAFLVKIDLPAHPSLRSGVFARARFAGEARQVLTVPGAAIVRQGQLSTLFVVTAQGRARMRVVRTGDSDADRVEVVAGLAPGEPVIVNPAPSLRDGDPVRAGPGAASTNLTGAASRTPGGR